MPPFFSLAALLGLASMASATPSPHPSEPIPLSVHHLQVSVADAEALAAWYVTHLGFKVTKRAAGAGVQVIWIDIPGFRIGLMQVPGSSRSAEMKKLPPEDVKHQGYRQIHFATPDVDAAHRRLSENGVRFVMAPKSFDPPGIRLATLVDPEGNLVSLYQDLDPANALLPARD